MKTKMVTLSLMFIVAGTLTACGAETPAVKPTTPEPFASTQVEGPTSVWYCYRMTDNAYVGYVSIFNGHTPVAATQACNQRIPACTNSPGKCLTRYAYAT